MDNPGPKFIGEALDETKRQGVGKTELSRRLRITKPSATSIFRLKNLKLGTMMRLAEVVGCTYEVKLITPNQMKGAHGE